jgi:uroporphyrinogen decarboxylase
MALNHEEPDRCPFQVSFTPEFADRLRAEMNLQSDHVHNPHGGGNTYELERALDEDMLLTSVGWANSYYMDDKPYVDEWGVGWSIQAYETPFGVGHYTEMSHFPLADDDAILDHQCRKGPTQALADIVFRQGEHRLDQGLMSQVLFHGGGPVA